MILFYLLLYTKLSLARFLRSKYFSYNERTDDSCCAMAKMLSAWSGELMHFNKYEHHY